MHAVLLFSKNFLRIVSQAVQCTKLQNDHLISDGGLTRIQGGHINMKIFSPEKVSIIWQLQIDTFLTYTKIGIHPSWSEKQKLYFSQIVKNYNFNFNKKSHILQNSTVFNFSNNPAIKSVRTGFRHSTVVCSQPLCIYTIQWNF